MVVEDLFEGEVLSMGGIIGVCRGYPGSVGEVTKRFSQRVGEEGVISRFPLGELRGWGGGLGLPRVQVGCQDGQPDGGRGGDLHREGHHSHVVLRCLHRYNSSVHYVSLGYLT